MLNRFPIAVAAIVAIFLAIVALQPSDFRVERSATMRAPAPAAFAQVNDFQNVTGQFEQGLAQMKSVVEPKS